MSTDEPTENGDAGESEPIETRYTAFEKWEYRQIIYKTEHEQSWRDMAHGYFEASVLLVDGVAKGSLREDIEGLAAVFLFRHYLELKLKEIALRGRLLVSESENAIREDVKKVANTHELSVLWQWVLDDAKPKMSLWENYDTEFVGKCITEFDAVDKKGFAFRYSGQGGEFCRFDFAALSYKMRHIRDVSDGIATYLYEARQENREYDEYLEWEYGSSASE